MNVLVRTRRDGQFVVIRQTKYAIPDSTLAPVGGFIEDGETPLAAAKRELHEELSLRSTQWHALGSYVTSANRGGGRVHCFFADGGMPSTERAAADTRDAESQNIVRLSRASLLEALSAGRFGEVKWTATVALALLRTSTS